MKLSVFISLIILLSFSNLKASDSQSARESLKFQVAVPLMESIAHSFVPSFSGEFSYFVDQDSNAGLRYFKFDSSAAIEDVEYRGQAIELFYKKFSGNSFYTRFTLFYRDMNIDKDEDSDDDTDYVFRDIGGGFSIGNQWQWENFTIGCDWIGVNTRLVTLYYEDTKSSEVLFSTNGYFFTFNVVNLYIGYSF